MAFRTMATLGVVIGLAAGVPAAQAPAARTLSRPADGFAMSVPAGWEERADPDSAAALVQKAQPGVAAMVFVRKEPSRAAVTDVLAKAAVKLKADSSRTVVSSGFDVVLDRPALIAVLEDKTVRYKLTLLPRDEGDTSQIYYGVMALAPKALFAKAAPSLDRIIAGFRITPTVASGPTRGGGPSPASPAASAASAVDRAKVFERILASQARAMSPAGLPAQTKNQIEAAASYDKGLVFLQQGAYKEAEQAFRQSEKKDGKSLDYQFAAAWAYLKLHKPDDALKRYQKIYKNDPTNTRALVGMAAAYEEMLNFREAVRMWLRYAKMDLPPDAKAEAAALLRIAQDQFVREWEISENPAGGAANAASPDEERAWGLQYARELAASGIPLIDDKDVVGYVQGLCEDLVSRAKGFPRKYELFVLDNDTVNAQTTPGFIFVYRGILETVQSEQELAGVLAHELAHTIARHSGKTMTKAAKDQQTIESLQRSNNKLAKFLAGLMAMGNPMGAMAFSREQEAQADRIAIHIAFDSGYDPRGLSSLFRKFESLQPSSRKSWDLMMKTHPFPIDRMNTVNDYMELLPARTFAADSPGFGRMKTRLAKLPPPPEPTPAPAAPGADGAVIPYTVDNAPFAGEIPATWVARKTDGGTIVFEGQKGTEAYEATVELEIAPKATVPGRTLEDIVQLVYDGTAAKPGARVQRPEAHTDGSLRTYTVAGAYQLQANGRTIGYRHLSVVADYPAHFVIMSYFAPDALFEKYAPAFQGIAGAFRHTGR